MPKSSPIVYTFSSDDIKKQKLDGFLALFALPALAKPRSAKALLNSLHLGLEADTLRVARFEVATVRAFCKRLVEECEVLPWVAGLSTPYYREVIYAILPEIRVAYRDHKPGKYAVTFRVEDMEKVISRQVKQIEKIGYRAGLRTAILGKRDPSFPFCGKPDGIQSDNGGIFESADYADCLLRLNIIRHEIPSESPSANGKVERWFRTIQDGLIRRLNGFSDQVGGLASARESAIPWPVLPRIVSQFMAKYHSDLHSSIKMSPWEAWHERLVDAKGLGVAYEDVINATMVRHEVQVQRDGVHLDDGNTYSDPCLTG